MSYQSIDMLQKSLAATVFSNKKDAKKAAGRALGTIVEIITYYLLREWGLMSNIQIETKLAEYGNPEITHNVEFTLHRVLKIDDKPNDGPATYARLLKKFDYSPKFPKNGVFIDRNAILKNSAVIGKDNETTAICNLNDDRFVLSIAENHAVAMIECKRVGVEEGQKKGPQTIEKAKQGAYVALKSSSLQKVRDNEGNVYGVYFKDGILKTKRYEDALNDCMLNDKLDHFILTLGVVSNHGNWFTSEDMNKELKVLAQSYDRLLFLTDKGLSTFIDDVILRPDLEFTPIREAFISSYVDGKKVNAFTKSKIFVDAHNALIEYFRKNIKSVEGWFNIISPHSLTMSQLKGQLIDLVNRG